MIWLPGGYPELHAGRLATAETCFAAIRTHAKTRPVHGECGGYMVLGKQLIDKEGTAHNMLGLLGLVTSYAERKFHLGYRLARAVSDNCLFEQGTVWRGHEFHYSRSLTSLISRYFWSQMLKGIRSPKQGLCVIKCLGHFSI